LAGERAGARWEKDLRGIGDGDRVMPEVWEAERRATGVWRREGDGRARRRRRPEVSRRAVEGGIFVVSSIALNSEERSSVEVL